MIMNNLHIKRAIRVQCHFTQSQWNLYDLGSVTSIVADALNREIERCINLGYTKEDTSRFVRSVMRNYAEFGANDTEPHRFLEQVLEEIYTQPLEF